MILFTSQDIERRHYDLLQKITHKTVKKYKIKRELRNGIHGQGRRKWPNVAIGESMEAQ